MLGPTSHCMVKKHFDQQIRRENCAVKTEKHATTFACAAKFPVWLYINISIVNNTVININLMIMMIITTSISIA